MNVVLTVLNSKPSHVMSNPALGVIPQLCLVIIIIHTYLYLNNIKIDIEAQDCAVC